MFKYSYKNIDPRIDNVKSMKMKAQKTFLSTII